MSKMARGLVQGVSCVLGAHAITSSRMHDGIPAQKKLAYAFAYLSLGLVDEAEAELGSLLKEERDSPDTLAIFIDLHMARKAWGLTVDTAREYTQLRPREEKGWISWAFALRELERVQEARDVLLNAEPLHGKSCALLHYNLACYYCLLGEMDEARRRLSASLKMDLSLAEESKTDPDLKGLGLE